jgi:hypothetical protein
MSLRKELEECIDAIVDCGGSIYTELLADRIISLLDKKVQEAGWVVSVDVTRALERDEGVTRPATLEELLNNKAHRTGGG